MTAPTIDDVLTTWLHGSPALHTAEIIDGNPDDEWYPDWEDDEYRLWLQARDDAEADDAGVPW